jgi:hypothetical protein
MNLNKPSYITAVKSLVGGDIGGYNDGPIEKIKFFDGQTPPTEEAIQAKLAELQAEYESNQYQRDRASQYPSIQDQLDMLYHQGIDGWKAEIQKVKDAHPKPEST